VLLPSITLVIGAEPVTRAGNSRPGPHARPRSPGGASSRAFKPRRGRATVGPVVGASSRGSAGDGRESPRARRDLPRRSRRRRSLAALLAALLSTSLAAARPVIVVAADPAAPARQAELLDALDGQLAELGVEVVLSASTPGGEHAAPAPLTEGRELLAFVLVEQTPTALVVHFYEPAGTSLRERRIPVTGAGSTSIEEVAIVVRSAASALLERARPKPAPEPPPAAPPPPPPTPGAPLDRPGPVELSLAYSGQPYALDLPWQHGARAALAWRSTGSPLRLGADYLWVPPLELRSNEVTVALQRRPLELFIGYAIPVGGPRLELQPEGAVNADPIRRRTERVTGSLEGTPPTDRWSWSVSTRLRLAWEPAPPWSVFLTGGAEFVLNRVEQVTEQVVLVSPLRARPRLDLGVAATPRRRRPPDFPRGSH